MKQAVSLLAAAILVALPAAAQTWTGAGPNDNWSTGANWSGGVAPASSPATQLTFGSTPRTSPVVDAPWTVGGMTFTSAIFPLGWNLSGQPITLHGGISAPFNTNVTISNALVLAAPVLFSDTAGTIRVDGPISGPGSLTVSTSGLGVAQLTAANSYTGGTTITFGTLHLDGSILGPVTVGSQGRLTGPGTVAGPVTLTGGAVLTPLFVFGTGNLTVGAGNSLDIVLLGPAQGTQYSTVNVTGTVNISGARLDFPGTYAPQPGDVFTIIANDGTDPVVGTFVGLPEGATFTAPNGGSTLRISYVGGTGNDVTLSAAPGATNLRQVPTLSGWALIVLASMVLGIGVLRSR